VERRGGLLIFFLSLMAGCAVLWAKGTAAGTQVSNQVLIRYALPGSSQEYNLSSNTESFLVDRVVDVRIDWNDADSVEVGPGEPDRVLSFLVSNLGNGEDNMTLSYEHNDSASFHPPVENVRIYLDSDGDGQFDPAQDALADRLTLPSDGNVTIFLLADMPAAPDANLSYEKLTVRSESNATAGAEDPGAVDVAVRRGEDTDQGIYRMRDYRLVSEKSMEILSPDGKLHTGSVVRYTLVVAIEGGAGRFDDVVVSDEIPEGTEYRPGSMTLDGAGLSDARDGDAGALLHDPERIRVELGVLEQSSPGRTERNVTFEVRVK